MPTRVSLASVTFSEPQRRVAVAGVVLVLLGLVFGGMSRVVAGTERHSFSPSAVPPADVQVVSGHTYLISVPGGVDALGKRGLDPSGLRCEWSSLDSAAQRLDVSLYGPDSKATNAIGSFVAPVTGSIHIDCVGWGTVFVDDAANASGDPAGLLIVLCIVALTLGAAFGLSALRSYRLATAGSSVPVVGEEDEIHRLVDIVHARSENGENGEDDDPDGVDDPPGGDRSE